LLQSVAADDQLALHALYERAHHLVFTLAMRVTGNREAAEELTVDVFYDVWRRVSRYDASNGTVLGWIMNQARLRFEQRKQGVDRGAVVDSFAASQDVLRPTPSLQQRLARRIAEEAGTVPAPVAFSSWSEPEWDEVSPGISCKTLATDEHRHRVSMLVRLAPGTAYPPHTHAGLEELHLLHGELWIDDRKLNAGDYNRAEPGTSDKRVWSETGCTCVLVTSTQDLLR
jgi:anti-sigma factor ChrR (cupin superfamily)